MSTAGRNVLAPGTVLTANGNTGALALASSSAHTVTLMGDISAITGAGASITFGIAWDNGADQGAYPPPSYGTPSTGSARTTTGSNVTLATLSKQLVTEDEPRYYKVTWTVAGTTPSFTLDNLWIVES